MDDRKLQEEIAILTKTDAAYEAAAEEDDNLTEEILELAEEDDQLLPGLDDDTVEPQEDLILEDEEVPEASEIESETGEEAESDASAAQTPGRQVVGVRFRTAGKSYYFAVGELPVKRGTHVIVETSRGLEYGTSVCDPFVIDRKQFKAPVKRIVRIATPADDQHVSENREKEKEAYRVCYEKIRRRGLDMKLIDAEYAFDNSKILFYFTSDGRVDFRDLVKDLAGVFHTRIELRQIGVRDETKILGGYGICGRPLCCHTYLSDFAPVSIRMAKEQNLSLNPTKISGSCGRLMCCLKNEAETYEELNKNMPGLGDEVEGSDGLTGEVAGVDILRQMVRILVEVDDEKELHEYRADEITVLRKRRRGQSKPKLNRSEVRDATGRTGNGHPVGSRSGRPSGEGRRDRSERPAETGREKPAETPPQKTEQPRGMTETSERGGNTPDSGADGSRSERRSRSRSRSRGSRSGNQNPQGEQQPQEAKSASAQEERAARPQRQQGGGSRPQDGQNAVPAGDSAAPGQEEGGNAGSGSRSRRRSRRRRSGERSDRRREESHPETE